MSGRASRSLRRAPARGLAAACYVALCLAGWAAVTMACVMALWALFFAALGQFTFSGTVLHLENFASRYIAAEPARQDSFRALFWAWSTGLFVIAGFFRRTALIDLKTVMKERPDGQE